MSRETKVGIVVTISFLCLVGVVLANKLRSGSTTAEHKQDEVVKDGSSDNGSELAPAGSGLVHGGSGGANGPIQQTGATEITVPTAPVAMATPTETQAPLRMPAGSASDAPPPAFTVPGNGNAAPSASSSEGSGSGSGSPPQFHVRENGSGSSEPPLQLPERQGPAPAATATEKGSGSAIDSAAVSVGPQTTQPPPVAQSNFDRSPAGSGNSISQGSCSVAAQEAGRGFDFQVPKGSGSVDSVTPPPPPAPLPASSDSHVTVPPASGTPDQGGSGARMEMPVPGSGSGSSSAGSGSSRPADPFVATPDNARLNPIPRNDPTPPAPSTGSGEPPAAGNGGVAVQPPVNVPGVTNPPPPVVPPSGGGAVTPTQPSSIPEVVISQPISPTAPARPNPSTVNRGGVVSTSWDESVYHANPGDTMESISQLKYGDPRYAAALLAHNRIHALASSAIKSDPPQLSGQVIYVPPTHILVEKYPQYIRQ